MTAITQRQFSELIQCAVTLYKSEKALQCAHEDNPTATTVPHAEKAFRQAMRQYTTYYRRCLLLNKVHNPAKEVYEKAKPINEDEINIELFKNNMVKALQNNFKTTLDYQEPIQPSFFMRILGSEAFAKTGILLVLIGGGVGAVLLASPVTLAITAGVCLGAIGAGVTITAIGFFAGRYNDKHQYKEEPKQFLFSQDMPELVTKQETKLYTFAVDKEVCFTL